MLRLVQFVTTTILCLLAVPAKALCFDPTPAFPPPDWGQYTVPFDYEVFDILAVKLRGLYTNPGWANSSTVIELTSNTEFQFAFFHSAEAPNTTTPGIPYVNRQARFRVGSVTKVFTTLAVLQLHAAGKLDINKPISNYISELAGHDTEIPWKNITLRAMASQLSGIPGDFGLSHLNDLSRPWQYGLPPESQDAVPPCFRQNACTTDDMIKYVKTYKPIYAPNVQSTYANLNFELLGIVVERASGLKYEDYISQHILKPLDMTHSTFDTPPANESAIPPMPSWWGVDLGIFNPAGGLYTTSEDLSKFMRYILEHYNDLVNGINWFQPASYSDGMQSAYGAPWEIYRTDKILLNNRRPVTFYTKSGDVQSYHANIIMVPEYNLAFSILVAGEVERLNELRELVVTDTIQACENAIWSAARLRYSGQYTAATGLNSSVVISTSLERGMTLDSFISNGTDVSATFFKHGLLGPDIGNRPWHLQLIPTLLNATNDEGEEGEIFRFVLAPERSSNESSAVWDDICVRDVDLLGPYAGLPANEVIFWHATQEIELPAWRVTLKRCEARNMLRLQSSYDRR